MEEKLKPLINYVQSEGRVCPMPTFWNDMWNMLPDRIQKENGGWDPSLPLILAAWGDTTAGEKRDRLKLHIEYAANKGILDKVDKFIRGLKPDQWAYDNNTTIFNNKRAVNLKEYYHYRLTLSSRKIAMLEVKTKDNTFVKTNNFLRPITANKLSKIYIIKNGGKIIYVGIASQSIMNRLRYGFAAKGKGGYHGYRWKDLNGKLDLLVWCFPRKSLHCVESIEAEIVLAVRCETGQWPLYQTEIHFRNITDEEKKLAQLIYDRAKNV